MRFIRRLPLGKNENEYLEKKKILADQKRASGMLAVSSEWDSARSTKSIKTILGILKLMSGTQERCMYCLDSHGSDIEHFWPKASYPEKMFVWENLLLCCAECGRFKGSLFPLDGGVPLLVDPTAEDPWDYLDFHPETGNIVAKFDVQANEWSAKGLKTVEVFQLDRREGMSAGYMKTYRRISGLVENYFTHPVAVDDFLSSLKDADDHGLLFWCFFEAGKNMEPFNKLREREPDLWKTCVKTFGIK